MRVHGAVHDGWALPVELALAAIASGREPAPALAEGCGEATGAG